MRTDKDGWPIIEDTYYIKEDGHEEEIVPGTVVDKELFDAIKKYIDEKVK
jgi:hypothetical protein